MSQATDKTTKTTDLGEPVNDRNLRCWATDNGLEIRFTPHLDLATTGPTRARFGVAGYTFHDVPMEVVAGLRHLQDTCAQLQERVWELEDRLDD